MSIDPSNIGKTYPPSTPYVVGREKIREFASAIGATASQHYYPEAARVLGYLDVIAPPTFPMVVTNAASRQIIEDPALAIDYSRVVHGDQRFSYTRPIVAGDELVCTSTIEDIISRKGHDFITSRTEVITADGEPVVVAWSKLVVRGDDHEAG